jgi:hypothetical protein
VGAAPRELGSLLTPCTDAQRGDRLGRHSPPERSALSDACRSTPTTPAGRSPTPPPLTRKSDNSINRTFGRLVMASQFCMSCGKPLPAEAQFCLGCGTPVGSISRNAPVTPPAPGGTPTPPGQAPPPPPPPPPGTPGAGGADPAAARLALGSALGLQGVRNFLLQHQLVSGGRSYRVLNGEKRHLLTVKENFGQEMRSNFMGGMLQQNTGFGIGRLGMGTQTFAWTVLDSAGTLRGHITIQLSGYSASSTLADAAGNPLLLVNVNRGMVGGLTATAAAPDGRPMFQTQGNQIRHNFSVHDPTGREVAKIHEAWASVRDTYALDLLGNVDPLCALVFAILIDREKESK